mgnify:CR=1 FL=1
MCFWPSAFPTRSPTDRCACTLGRDTTLEDVDFAVDSLKATLQNLRMMSPLYEDFQQGKVESVIERFKADGFPYAN